MNEHPGLKLTAIENADGSWNILDVPVLPPVPKGAKLNDEEIGVEWMNEAVRLAQNEAHLGHLGSISMGHHPDVNLGPSSQPGYAGKILPTRVGTSRMRDEGTIPCMFADFLFVPPDVVDLIERGDLSYRSPEVVNWAKFRMDNVSLLSTEPPFFRLPMLGIGERIPFNRGAQETFESEEAFATARFTDGSPPIYRFSEEVTMSKEKKPTAKFEDGEDKKDEEDDAKMEDGGLNVDAIVSAIESGEIMVKDFAAIEAAMSAAAGSSEEEAPPEDEAVMQEEEEKRLTPGPVQMSDREVKQQAEIDALKAFQESVEHEKAVTARIQKATAKFTDAGKSMPERIKKGIAKMAETAGNAQFDLYVNDVFDLTTTTPAATFRAAESRAVTQDSKAVAKFAAGNPDKLVKAREFSRMYHKAQDRGWGLSCSEEEYIETGFRRDAQREVS